MDSYNNNFKSFDDQNTDLPEGFDWDDMKEGVYAQMPPKKKRRVAAWWWLGSGLSGLAIATLFFMNPFGLEPAIQASGETSPVAKTLPQDKAETAQLNATHTNAESNSTMAGVYKKVGEHTPQQEVNPSTRLSIRPTQTELSATTQRDAESILTKVQVNKISPEIATSLSVINTDQKVGNELLNKENNRSAKNASLQILSSLDGQPAGLKSPVVLSERKIVSRNVLIKPISTSILQPFATESNQDKLGLQTPIVNSPNPTSSKGLRETNREGISLHNLLHPKSTVPAGNYLVLEGFVVVPTATKSVINAPYLSSWIGTGGAFGFQKQFEKRFGFSANYSFKTIKQEFSFSGRDTIGGSDQVDRRVDYINSANLALLSSSMVSEAEQFDRQRNVLSYNRFEFHQISAFVHYLQPINMRSNLDFGLGGAIAFLRTAEGLRLDDTGEIVNIAGSYDYGNTQYGSLDGHIRYVYQLSPKLNMSGGLNYSHVLKSGLPRNVGLSAGVRWKF